MTEKAGQGKNRTGSHRRDKIPARQKNLMGKQND